MAAAAAAAAAAVADDEAAAAAEEVADWDFVGLEDDGDGELFDVVFEAALWALKATSRLARKGLLVGMVVVVCLILVEEGGGD